VLFLAPVVTAGLLEIHARLHKSMGEAIEGSWVYYFPNGWVPHCTLSIRLSAKKLAKGMELIRKSGLGIQGQYNRLALVETHPVHIKPIRLIYSMPFSGKKTEVKNV